MAQGKKNRFKGFLPVQIALEKRKREEAARRRKSDQVKPQTRSKGRSNGGGTRKDR